MLKMALRVGIREKLATALSIFSLCLSARLPNQTTTVFSYISSFLEYEYIYIYILHSM